MQENFELFDRHCNCKNRSQSLTKEAEYKMSIPFRRKMYSELITFLARYTHCYDYNLAIETYFV